MLITMVKKIKADGSTCNKCAEVAWRLQQAGLDSLIDKVVIADERDPDSAGMQLARQHQVEVAPFFIVEHEDGTSQIHTLYFRFVKEVLKEGMKDGPNEDLKATP